MIGVLTSAHQGDTESEYEEVPHPNGHIREDKEVALSGLGEGIGRPDTHTCDVVMRQYNLLLGASPDSHAPALAKKVRTGMMITK